MKTKEELIREAYGPEYEMLKPNIDMDTGLCSAETPQEHLKRGIAWRVGDIYNWWPRGLRPALENNGWQDIKTFELIPGTYYEFYSIAGEHAMAKVKPWGIKRLKNIFILVKPILLSSPPIYV